MIAHWKGKNGWLSGEIREVNGERRVLMPDGIHSFSVKEIKTSKGFYITDNELTKLKRTTR